MRREDMPATIEERFEELKRDMKGIMDEAGRPHPSDYGEAIRRLTGISYKAHGAYMFACARPEDININMGV